MDIKTKNALVNLVAQGIDSEASFRFLKNLRSEGRSKDQLQVLILAAGRGTRFGAGYPKSLHKLEYPNRSTSLIENLMNVLNVLDRFIGITEIAVAIRQEQKDFFSSAQLGPKARFIILPDAAVTGTAPSIAEAKKYLGREQSTLILWGDLALIPSHILVLSGLFHLSKDANLTFPTRIVDRPYVAFERDDSGHITRVLHKNEGSKMPEIGEQDCLSFFLSPVGLELIEKFLHAGSDSSHNDFVHFIPFLQSALGGVFGLPIADGEKVSGLNTREKAHKLENKIKLISENDYENGFLGGAFS